MDTEKIKLRIEELKFKKRDLSSLNLPLWLAILFGMTNILFKLLDYYSEKKDLTGIIRSTIIWGIVLLGTYLIFNYAGKKEKRIDSAIQNNYDILLSRTKIKSDIWKKRMLK
ncbi:MAG TPA: hypothetical protein VJB13_01755 [Candidatus Nanoarchaeia archaeon]|nr:hypothetical protein [Candidatus Nanoarchaeia archaeon]